MIEANALVQIAEDDQNHKQWTASLLRFFGLRKQIPTLVDGVVFIACTSRALQGLHIELRAPKVADRAPPPVNEAQFTSRHAKINNVQRTRALAACRVRVRAREPAAAVLLILPPN